MDGAGGNRMDRVRLGFVGCGGVAQQHFKGLAELPDAEMVAFCDINAEAAEKSAAQYGGRAFTSHEAMLGDTGLDALYIILPPFAHGPAEHAAIERRMPFFVEKPVGNDLEVC